MNPPRKLTSELIQPTKQKRRTNKPSQVGATTIQTKDSFLSTSSTKIRQIPEGQKSSLGKGAGRVDAIIDGAMLVKGILDPGVMISHS